jgi:hypothetical protein
MDTGDKIKVFFIFFCILFFILAFYLFITPSTTATSTTAPPGTTPPPDAFQQILNLFKAAAPPSTTPPATTSAPGNQTTPPATTSAPGNQTTPPATTSAPSQLTQVLLCTDINAGGSTVSIPVGKLAAPNLGIPGASLKSIQIPTGYKVVLFDGLDYTGYCVILTSGSTDLSNVNFSSRMNSIIVYDEKTEIDKTCLFTFWTGPSYSGVSFTFMGSNDPTVVVSVSDLPNSIPTLNDAIQSIQMPKDIAKSNTQPAISFQLALYANPNFSGVTAVLNATNTTELSKLSYMSKLTSSFRIDNTGIIEPAVGCFNICSTTVPAVCYLSLGNYDIGDLTANGLNVNDTISQLTVPTGLTATIYADPGYSGYSYMVNAGIATCLSKVNGTDGYDFTKKTSSIKITKDTDPRNNVIIYDTSNYGGTKFEFGYGKYDIGALNISGVTNFNDNIGSLKIPNDKKVVLFADPGFTGQAVVLTKDNSDLGRITDNQYNNINLFKQTSSFIVLGANDDIPVPFATWYVDINYGGVCGSWGTGWAGGVGNKPTGIPDKSMSSIKISPHTKVDMYRTASDPPSANVAVNWQQYITESLPDATKIDFSGGGGYNVNDNTFRFHVGPN